MRQVNPLTHRGYWMERLPAQPVHETVRSVFGIGNNQLRQSRS
jgi:hypothetical protein